MPPTSPRPPSGSPARSPQPARSRRERSATGGNPVVYAEWMGAPGKPTVLVYGHYDVQPPDPLEKWQSPPFVPAVRNGRLYARGVSDDKGPMLIPIKVAEAFFAACGNLPVNVKLMFEGEEEIGSPEPRRIHSGEQGPARGRFRFVGRWRHVADRRAVTHRGQPRTGRARADAHRRVEGSALGSARRRGRQPAARDGATDRDAPRCRRPRFRGRFYDAVCELTPAERAEIAALPFDDRAYLAQVGAPATFGEAGYTTLERQWTRPTLEVNGMWGGYEGPGQKTVIPTEAHAKITCRLVPNQDPDDVVALRAASSRGACAGGTRLTISPGDHGARPYSIAAEPFCVARCRGGTAGGVRRSAADRSHGRHGADLRVVQAAHGAGHRVLFLLHRR